MHTETNLNPNTPNEAMNEDSDDERERLKSVNLTREARNLPVRPSQEKFHTVVLKGVRNISDTLSNPHVNFPVQKYHYSSFAS